MSPRDTDRVTEARVQESGLGPVDAPPTQEQLQAEAQKYASSCFRPGTAAWHNVADAFVRGANWRARQ